MKEVLYTVCLTVFLSSSFNLAAIEQKPACPEAYKDPCLALLAHTEYFGFTSLESYAKFARKFEGLITGEHQLDLLPIHQDPEIHEALMQISLEQATAGDWQMTLQTNISHRRKILANYLGVDESSLEKTLNAYYSYRLLRLQLDGIEQLASDKKVERIKVTARFREVNGGWGGIAFHIEVHKLAVSKGVKPYTLFTIVDTDTQQEKDFKYNRFSGIIYESEVRDCNECASNPSPF